MIDAESSDYDKLYEEMEDRDFSRFIMSANGTYHLPPAEYDYSDTADREYVLELAKAAARATGRKARILVTESKGRTWSNLEKDD